MKHLLILFLLVSSLCQEQTKTTITVPKAKSNTDFRFDTWTATAKKGSNKIVFVKAPNLKKGDPILFEFSEGRGKEAFDNWPDMKVGKLADLQKLTVENGTYVRVVETGNAMRLQDGKWDILSRQKYHGSEVYYSYGWEVKVASVTGNEVTVDKVSAIDYTGNVYFDNLPMLQALAKENTLDLSKYSIPANAILYVSGKIDLVNTNNTRIDFNNVQIRSPKGFPAPGIHINNGNGYANPLVLNANFYCYQGQYKFIAPHKSWLPQGAVYMYDPPYVYEAIIGMYCRGAFVKNAKVHNAPSYAIQLGDEDSASGVTITFDKDMFWEYRGWPMHIKGNKSAIRNFYFYSPTIMRALELQQCTGSIFENGEVINGVMSQNQGARGLVKNVRFTLKAGSAEADEKILYSPIIQANQLLSGSNESGIKFENVHAIQEGYLTSQGHLMRGWEFKEGTRGITLINCSNKRPDVKNPFAGNSYGQHLSAPADGLLINGFTSVGKAWPGHGCSGLTSSHHNTMVRVWGTGDGTVKNLTAEAMIITPGVKLEKVKTDCPVKLLN